MDVTQFGLLEEVKRCWKSNHTPMTAISRLHKLVHELSSFENDAVIKTEGLNAGSKGTAAVKVEHVGPVLFVHRDQLTLHTFRFWHQFTKMPSLAMCVAVEAEGMGSGFTELSEALPTVNVVGVGWDKQTARL